MLLKQLKSSGFLLAGNVFLKLSNFIKQILLAFFLGLSKDIDLLLLAQIIPVIIIAMFGGSAGEILVTQMKKQNLISKPIILTFMVLCLGLAIFFTIIGVGIFPIFSQFFNISSQDLQKFKFLSLLFVINLIPALVSALLRPVMFYTGKYKLYIFSTIFSEILGLIIILIFIKKIGIYAFALGIISISTSNAILFFILLHLSPIRIFDKKIWKFSKIEIIILGKLLLPLSGQTLINRISTFFERTLSVKYLQPGYLSGFNYSKSLAELPHGVIVSSILTTTYIEQINQIKINQEAFLEYTHKMYKLITLLSIIIQLGLMAMAPFLLIIFYRRGEFTNEDVLYILPIMQILILGLHALILNNFLSRTFFILKELNILFRIIVFKVSVQLLILFSFISRITQILPISYIIGYFINYFVLTYFLHKKLNGLISIKYGMITISFSFFFSYIIYLINFKLIEFYISLSNLEVFAIGFLFFIVFSGLLFLFFGTKIKSVVKLKKFEE